ncbi:hypothetical protein ACQBAU_07365 [Propionibacteriaceae bacterium Y2011]|uniref:hypothetical protein n=1 Tax=Microlunatus sp. Y2014 TaxID=3418488 RepID=UPI003B4DF429
METATETRCSRHWVQLTVLAALLIAGLLGMHALGGAAAAASASMTSSGLASPAVSGMNGMAGEAGTDPVPTASGGHGPAHGSDGCADAMSGGSTCVSEPTGTSVPALPAPAVVSRPKLVPAAAPMPPSQTPRRLALTHLELSIHRT